MEVEGYVRRTLTDIDRYQGAFEFLFQPRHDSIASEIDWELLFWTLHDGNFVWGPGTSRGDSTRRRYAVQALTRQLPTQGEQWRRRPEVYWNGWCRRCWQGPETQEHVWVCSRAEEVAHRALDAGLEEQVSELRAYASGGRAEAERQARLQQRWASANYLRGDREGREPPGGGWWLTSTGDGPKRRNKWVDLARGVVPREWRVWLQEAGLTGAQATTGALRAAQAIKRLVYDGIWRPRCTETVARERMVGITRRLKRRRRRRPEGLAEEGDLLRALLASGEPLGPGTRPEREDPHCECCDTHGGVCTVRHR
ncbi:hypothetical protein HK101_005080, partial [Irineochytrium annulatum]